MKAAFSKLIQSSNGNSNTHATLLQDLFLCKVVSTKAITGLDAPGIRRRPILSDEASRHVGYNLANLVKQYDEATDSSFIIQYNNIERGIWTPDPLAQVNTLMQQALDRKSGGNSKY